LTVQVNVSTNELHIGELVKVTLDVGHPDPGELRIPDLHQAPAVVVRNQEVTKRATAADRAATRVLYTLTSLQVGTHELFTNSLVFAREDGSELTASLPVVALTVASVLQGENETLRDIKGLANWPAAVPRWIPVLALIGLLALLLGWLARRFLLTPRLILKEAPALPAHDLALRALSALKGKNYIESGQVEPFYLELSAIVRRYLESRFELRAPEQTTEEFIREASTSRRLSRDHQNLTAEFLEQSDLVKFARFRPAPADMEGAFQAAERLVRETIPAPAPETAGTPG
jgi:hypothetical protein